MVSAAIVGAALQTPATRKWFVRLDDVDVTGHQGTHGHRVGVPVESLELDLEGSGGVSSASFALDDPDRSLTMREGARVEVFDVARDVPRFRGWLQNWSTAPLGISRGITVEAQGVEAVLDWAFIPGTLTIPAGRNLRDAIMDACSAAIYPQGGVAPIVAGITGGANGNAQAGAGVGSFLPFTYTLQQAAIITDTSLRDALRQIASVAGSVSLEGVLSVPEVKFTIDFLGYLRAWINTPADWDDVATQSGFGGGTAPTAPAYENDAGGAAHAVYVVGGNAAGTGLVTDGTGIPGQIARINDSTITTAEGKTTAALRYMQERSGLARMPVRLESYTPAGSPPGLGVPHPRPGARVQVRDAQLGIDPAQQFLMDGVTIGFNAGGLTENWDISAGGRRKSAITFIRRLTRGVKSA